MKYIEFMKRVKDISIDIDDSTGMCYILPDYRYLLHLSDLSIDGVEDFPNLTWDIVSECLHLEADKYNAKHNNANVLINRINDFLKNDVEPFLTAEENEIVKMLVRQLSEQKPKEKEDDIIRVPKYLNPNGAIRNA